MNKKRIEIGMVAKRSLPIFVFTTFLFVLADSAFATGADEKSTITDNKVKKAGMALIPAPMQQQKKISGVVTDDLGEPLPGVAIQVVGTPRGVTTYRSKRIRQIGLYLFRNGNANNSCYR